MADEKDPLIISSHCFGTLEGTRLALYRGPGRPSIRAAWGLRLLAGWIFERVSSPSPSVPC